MFNALPATTRGILLMVLAMAGFSMGDTMIKLVSGSLSVGYIMFLIGLGGAPIFAVMALRNGHALVSPAFFGRGMLLRNGAEIAGTICVITALSLAELSLVSAIMQAAPIFVTLGAAVAMGAPVGPRRWTAITVGLIGVLMVLQPGGGLSWGLWLALAGTVMLSVRDLATRLVPPEVPTLVMATYGFSMLIPSGLFLIALDPHLPVIKASVAGLLVVAIIVSVIGYYAITAAMRVGEVALVTPFRYTRILFALAIGVTFFGERPNALALAGVAVIVGSGLFILWAARQRAQE
ncbi:MAG: DMT family transporter [Pseudomonadota bacterium]